MGGQAGQDVVAVLPDGLGHNQRGVRVEVAEHPHAHFLGVNEAMLLLFIEGVRAHDLPAFGSQSLDEHGFHLRLLRPALLVGGKPQITAGHQVNMFGRE
jgi:hypothetical protein